MKHSGTIAMILFFVAAIILVLWLTPANGQEPGRTITITPQAPVPIVARRKTGTFTQSAAFPVVKQLPDGSVVPIKQDFKTPNDVKWTECLPDGSNWATCDYGLGKTANMKKFNDVVARKNETPGIDHCSQYAKRFGEDLHWLAFDACKSGWKAAIAYREELARVK